MCWLAKETASHFIFTETAHSTPMFTFSLDSEEDYSSDNASKAEAEAIKPFRYAWSLRFRLEATVAGDPTL